MKKTTASSKATAPAKGKSPQQVLVAIVDDDESVREAVGSLFRSMGFRTELFGRGRSF
jgi:FixJ family two-component response regulator